MGVDATPWQASGLRYGCRSRLSRAVLVDAEGVRHCGIVRPRPMDHDLRREIVIRRVTRRIIPFAFICYVVAYIDRVNIGFAARELQHDLALSATWCKGTSDVTGGFGCIVPIPDCPIATGDLFWQYLQIDPATQELVSSNGLAIQIR